jgi:hypothetical protein
VSISEFRCLYKNDLVCRKDAEREYILGVLGRSSLILAGQSGAASAPQPLLSNHTTLQPKMDKSLLGLPGDINLRKIQSFKIRSG